MWRCSASTTRRMRRCGCTSASGRRDRGVWAAAGRCDPTASSRWGWRASPRSVGLFGWCSRRRWRCARRRCPAGAVTEQDPEIAPERERLTTRAGRWATRRAGRGRPVKDVASELGCSWHPVNMSVRRWGEALLDTDAERISDVAALGLDEHLIQRRGRFRTKAWATSIVDVMGGRLLDMCGAALQIRPHGGCSSGPADGSIRSAGGYWTCRGRIGPRSTPRCPPQSPEPDPGTPRPQARPHLQGPQAARVGV